jgi:hypothetical protein
MSDQLIDDYVRDLRVSAWIRQLPAPRTKALENEVRERIAGELAAAGNRDEATVNSVLDRMGPPSEFVAQQDAAPVDGAHRAINTVLTPVARLRFMLAARGWGAAEIGGLLLLIVGPFLLWWIGPILGIILVRGWSDRWSERAEHKTTVVVFSLLTVQAILAIGLFFYVLAIGGPLGEQLQRVMSNFGPGAILSGLDNPAGLGPGLFWLRIGGGLLAPIAGVVGGVYLALSPRVRR